MPSISNLYFVPFNDVETSKGVDDVRQVIADKYVYTASDVSMHCSAILNFSGSVVGDLAEVYLKTSDLLTTVTSGTKTATIDTNRIFFTVDITNLDPGSYTLQAFISDSGSPGTPIGSLVSFNFSKTEETESVTFPSGGLQIYPQTQTHIDDVSYPTHAAIPIPKGTLAYSDVASLGLYEDDVQIPAQIEVVDNWEGVTTKAAQNHRPRWIHVWFNAVWDSGTPRTYLLKKDAGTPPDSGVSITEENPATLASFVDTSTNTFTLSINLYLGMNHVAFTLAPTVLNNVFTTNGSYGLRSGTPIIYSSYGSAGNLTRGSVYFVRAITHNTLSLHPTYDDAINNTNILNTGSATNSTFHPLSPIPIKINFGFSESSVPDAYPRINPNKVYWAHFVEPGVSAARFKLYETYEDAIDRKNEITLLNNIAGVPWRLLSPRVIQAETTATEWRCTRGHNDVISHGMSTGMKVRGTLYYPDTTGLEDGAIYYVRVTSSTNFTLHPTADDATTGTNAILVSTSFDPHYFAIISTITVDNGYVKASFSRPFDGIHELYYDETGSGSYGSTPLISSEDAGFNSGIYLMDGIEHDWNSFADTLGYVEVETRAADTTQNCNVVVHAKGKIQLPNKWLSPVMGYSSRISIPNDQSILKFQLASTILETVSRVTKRLCFYVPLQDAYLLSGGIDDGTISPTSYTISSVSTPTITLSGAHGWSAGQQIVFYTTGTLPSPLVQGTVYYVKNPSGNTLRVATTSGGSDITLTTSGTGTNTVYTNDSLYFLQKKDDVVSVTGLTTSSGNTCDGWFVASGLAGGVRTTLLTKDIWQKFPKEVELNRNKLAYHIWPVNGARNFTTSEEAAASGVYKYNCFHQHICLDPNVPNDYYQAWADQTDTSDEIKPEWVMAANAQGVSMNNEFALIFSDADGSFDSDSWADLYQQDPIALCAEDWNANSKVFGSMAEKGVDFAEQEAAIEDAVIAWTDPAKVDDYGQFNYGDYHDEYLPSVPRANLQECWQNMRHYFVSQVWSLILRGSDGLMDIARRSTDHYTSVDQTSFDGNFGYFSGDTSVRNIVDNLVDGPEHKNHVPGNFWKGGPIHWANIDYGMEESTVFSGIYGSIPDPVGLLRAWLIDANGWAKEGYEQWQHAMRCVTLPSVTGLTANKESIGTLVNTLILRDYTKNPVLSPQINAVKTALASTTSKAAVFVNGTSLVTITGHGYKTGQRIRFTTTGSLPTSYPQITVGTTYYVSRISTSQVVLHQNYKDAIKYVHGTNTAITFSSTGSGSHTAITGNIDNIDDPTWHPLWMVLYYELTKDPNHVQWIKDNAKSLGYGLSGAAYAVTSEPIYLTRHFPELMDHSNFLHEAISSVWDNFGVGPGEHKHFWHTFPYFKKNIKNAAITSLSTPTITLQPGSSGIDTYISSGSQSTNFGNATVLPLGNLFFITNTKTRILIRFDLALPEGAIVTSATLTMTNVAGGTGISNTTITAYRVIRPWTESNATWLKYNSTTNWSTAGGGSGTDYTTANSVTTTIANSSSNLVFNNLATLVQDAVDSRDGRLSLLLVGDETAGSSHYANFASSDNATSANRPKLTITWTTPTDSGSYPVALGEIDDFSSPYNTILVNNLITPWDLTVDVADISITEEVSVEVSTISGNILNTFYEFPETTSFYIDNDGTLVHRQIADLPVQSAYGNLQIVNIRSNVPQLFIPISSRPEALLMTDYGESTSPIYRGKNFKGYLIPKVVSEDVNITFTPVGEGGFVKILLKDDDNNVISNVSLLTDVDNPLSVTINDSNMSNPIPWYVEVTSGRNSFVDIKIEGLGDPTPLLFGPDRDETYDLKYWAIGTPVANFTESSTGGETPYSITFTDTSENSPTSWSWNFGDGKTSTEQNPTHIFTKSGTFTVTLTATSPSGSSIKTKTNLITITDELDSGPMWGFDDDPLAELMNRGEGTISAASLGYAAVMARNPMLVMAPDGSILFFCHSASGFTNDGHGLTFAIRMKKSTDNGNTWSDPVDIYNYSNYDPNASWFELSGAAVDETGIGEEDPSVTVFGTKGDTTNQHHQVYTFRSTDNGDSWSGPTEITNDIVNPLYTAITISAVDTGTDIITTSTNHGLATGQPIVFSTTGTLPDPLVAGRTYFVNVTGLSANEIEVYPTYDDIQDDINQINLTDTGSGTHSVTPQWAWNTPVNVGIQLKNSVALGRLIVPCTFRSIGFNPNDDFVGTKTSHLIYSDDGGLTWDYLGRLIATNTAEGAILETNTSNRLIINMNNTAATARSQSVSVNGGVGWSAPATVAVMLQADSKAQMVRVDTDLIILATSRDANGVYKKEMTLYKSTNEGTTWEFYKTIYFRYADSVSILALNDNHILMAFENGANDLSNAIPSSSFADKSYQSISLVKLNRTWLDNSSPTIYSDWFFNEEESGVLTNPYGPGFIDYGGLLNNKAIAETTTNTPSYGATGVALSSGNDNGIELTPETFQEFFQDGITSSITIEVEATVGVDVTGNLISNRATNGISLSVNASGYLVGTINDGTITVTVTGNTAIDDGARRCYALVRDKTANRAYLYIDGVAESGDMADNTSAFVPDDPLTLGHGPSDALPISATIHSCRITNKALSSGFQTAPRTKTTLHSFRNYTPPTPPAFVPSDLTDLETWLFASVDGGEAGFADSQWSLSYKLPYYSGAKIASYRDKSSNKYFFNTTDDGWAEYYTDSTIGPHYRPFFESTTPANARFFLRRAAASTYNFVPGTGPNGDAMFAISMAIRINSMVGGGNQYILDTKNGLADNGGFAIYINSNRKPAFMLGGNPTAKNYTYTAADALTIGDWYFLLYVGRGFGAGVDLYIGHYTNGAYNPSSPTVPTLTKYTSTGYTEPGVTTCTYALSINNLFANTSPSDIHLKNLLFFSESSQFGTGDTINQDKLCAFNVQA